MQVPGVGKKNGLQLGLNPQHDGKVGLGNEIFVFAKMLIFVAAFSDKKVIIVAAFSDKKVIIVAAFSDKK